MKILNTLIPGFEAKAIAAENIAHYCAPVSLTIMLFFDQSDNGYSCKQVRTMHAAMIPVG